MTRTVKTAAQLDENNVVIRAILVSENNTADESTFSSFLQTMRLEGGNWKITDRAYKDDIYIESSNTFVRKSPFPSWILDTETLRWGPPTPKPEDTTLGIWIWDEDNLVWKLISKKQYRI